MCQGSEILHSAQVSRGSCWSPVPLPPLRCLLSQARWSLPLLCHTWDPRSWPSRGPLPKIMSPGTSFPATASGHTDFSLTSCPSLWKSLLNPEEIILFSKPVHLHGFLVTSLGTSLSRDKEAQGLLHTCMGGGETIEGNSHKALHPPHLQT